MEGIGDMAYGDMLSFFYLYSIRGRLLRADLIKCWKVFHGECSVSPTDIFVFPPVSNLTRGHRFKLGKVRCRLECRRRFFSVRVVNSWNALPDNVVGAASLNQFKSALHNHLGASLFEF